MNSLSGFIKLHRKLVAWGWYQDSVVKDVFLHLLLTANFKTMQWKNITLQEGQVVVGSQKLADELGFSRQQVRTALKKLSTTNEITVEPYSKFSIITIVNWRDYQSENGATTRLCDGFVNKKNFSENSTKKITKSSTNKKAEKNKSQSDFFELDEEKATKTSTKSLTNNQPTTNQQLTNKQPQRKNVKNDKKERMVRRERGALSPRGQFLNVFLSDAEVADLAEKYPHDYERKIERLSRYIESNGKDYPNHYIKLMDWLDEDVGAPGRSKDVKTKSSYDIDELEEINTLDDWGL